MKLTKLRAQYMVPTGVIVTAIVFILAVISFLSWYLMTGEVNLYPQVLPKN